MCYTTSASRLLTLVVLVLAAFGLNAQLTVYSNADDGPGSLRDVIRKADNGALIFIDEALDDASVLLTSGPIKIDKDIYLFGAPDHKLKVIGNSRDRLFEILQGTNVDLAGIALVGGNSDKGGAIAIDRASLRLLDSDLMDNQATGDGGGAVYAKDASVDFQRVKLMRNGAKGDQGRGGAVLLDGRSRLTARDSDFADNEATKSGGAIEDRSLEPLGSSLSDSRLVRNKADKRIGAGGAICVSAGADYTLSSTLLADNSAAKGGAVYAKDSKVQLDRSVVARNSAKSGGGLYNDRSDITFKTALLQDNDALGTDDGDGGGAVYNDGGLTLVTDRTVIQKNKASGKNGSGGGVLNGTDGRLNISNTEISFNDATKDGGGISDKSGDGGGLTLLDSDIARNRALGKPADPNDTSDIDRGGRGGGIIVEPNGRVSIKRTAIAFNSARDSGGGLYSKEAQVEIDESDIEGNEAAGKDDRSGGGGLYNDGGSLTLTNRTRIKSNRASGELGKGGGLRSVLNAVTLLEDVDLVENEGTKSGGGIEDGSGPGGSLTLRRVNLSDNKIARFGDGDGGGLSVRDSSDVLIEDSDLFRNKAQRDGGAIYSKDSKVTLRRTNIADNETVGFSPVDGGGGIYSDKGLLEVLNSAVYRNAVKGASSAGGGIYNADGSLMLKQSTVGDNYSAFDFGGIANDGDADVISSTIAKNRSVNRGGGIGLGVRDNELRVRSSLIAKNIADSGFGQDVDRNTGTYRSGGYNLVGTDDGFVFTGGIDDQVGQGLTPIDPRIDELSVRTGRRTPTYKLLCGSPARDKGDPNDLEQDQDGTDVVNGRRDIGAYEADDVCGTLPRSGGAVNAVTTTYGIFPNPAVNTQVNVQLTAGDPTVQRQIELVNGLGQIVRAAFFVGETTFVPVADLSSGYYQIRIHEGEAVAAYPVEIRH